MGFERIVLDQFADDQCRHALSALTGGHLQDTLRKRLHRSDRAIASHHDANMLTEDHRVALVRSRDQFDQDISRFAKIVARKDGGFTGCTKGAAASSAAALAAIKNLIESGTGSGGATRS